MAKALKPQNSRVRGVVFELDRFELAPGHQCQLKGRWFGVRGRRFMRPALTLVGDGRRTRLLADLAHKPWNAEEGEPWQATFEGELEDAELLEAELTVAPDITITLPFPKAGARSAGSKPSRGRAQPPPPDGGRPRARGTADSRDQPRSRGTAAKGRLGSFTRELAEAQAELRQLRSQLARADADKAQAAARLDALLGELQEAVQARDRAEEGLDRIRAELLAAQQALEATRNETQAAYAARDRAHGERDAAVAAWKQAVAERDALQHDNERLQCELAERKTAHGAELVMGHAALTAPGARYPVGRSRAIAVTVLLATLLSLALVIALVIA